MSYSQLSTLLQRLSAEGFEAPATASRIVIARAAVAAASDLTRAAAALETAVASGDDAAAAEALHAYSAARGAGDAHHHADAGAAAALTTALTPSAFEFARARYDKAGAAFMRAVKKVDPEAAADTLDAKVFSTWQSVPGIVRELDLAAKLLGEVGGTLHDVSTRRSTGSASALGLFCSAGGSSDQLAAIWARGPQKGARGGIWGSLVAAGAILKAPATHGQHEPRFDAVPEPQMPVDMRDRTGGAPSGPALTPPAGYVEHAVERSTPPDDAGEDYDSFANAVRP